MNKRATVSFTENDIKRLQALQKALDLTSMSQTLSAAIKIADEIRSQKSSGNKIVFEKGQEKRELVIPGFHSDE